MKKWFYNSALLLFVFFFTLSLSQAQLFLDNWKTYSSLLNVNSASFDSRDRLWAGTDGGVFMYDPSAGTYSVFNNLNGMLTLDITTVKCNKETKKVFIGGFDGNLDIVSEDLNWTHITDIKNSRFPEPQINDIIFDGDLAYIAGGFGISVLDQPQNIFLQTPPRLGNFPPNTGIRKILKSGNELWAATKAGIARVNLKNSIINPDNWTNYTIANGLSDNNVSFIAEYKNQIYAAVDSNIFLFENDTFKFITKVPFYTSIQGLMEYNGKLCFSSNFVVQTLDYQNIYDFTQVRDTAFINGFSSDGKGKIVIFLKNSGVYLINETDSIQLKPNCPISSSFNGLAVDSYGTLWAAAGEKSQIKGFLKLENEIWENPNNLKYPNITTNYFMASGGQNGNVIISSWGKGYIRIIRTLDEVLGSEHDNYIMQRYDHSNSPLTGLNDAQDYIITGQSAYDRRNAMSWIVNYAPTSKGPLLVAQDVKGTFYSFENMISAYNRDFLTLVIDDNGTKWLGSYNAGGLYYFNEMNTFDKTSDDKWGSFNSSNSNLPNVTINALAVDKTGIIWVGTPTGLAVVLNPGAVLRNSNPYIRKVTILAQIAINSIMVDALNYKWIATNEGVWIINADGTEVIGYLNQKNSPLISDEVLSLANDPKTGRIYFGTKVGLNTVSSLSIEPLADFKIEVFPQPFNPEKDNLLIIEGLAQDADFSITTLDGELVKNIKTTGRKTIWDGRNELGNMVSAGIYLIVASSATKDATSVGKFAVIR